MNFLQLRRLCDFSLPVFYLALHSNEQFSTLQMLTLKKQKLKNLSILSYKTKQRTATTVLL